ncbi:MAG: primosomal protein N' [Pseudomonadales bacterium]|nr:primosomal protein N' [Pseudomonadales bacterium]MDG1444151.1 primosomal protein N' [Pseudomonadales bacterium]
MNPVYLDVAVPVPLRRTFQYLAPAGMNPANLSPGVRVEVNFGRQRLIGLLISTSNTNEIAVDKIKPALRVVDDQPLLDAVLFKLCLWATDYYQHPIGEVFQSAIPALLRQGDAIDQTEKVLVPLIKQFDETAFKRAPRQSELLSRLLSQPEGLSKIALDSYETTTATIRSLIAKELIQWDSKTVSVSHFDSSNPQKSDMLPLSNEQVDALKTALTPGTQLLFGITGSGKTEIYLQAIDAVLRQGKQALVLVPEIGLTPQTIERFTSRFNVPIYALHSSLTDKERLHAWRQAREQGAGIIIGTRSAIFTPMSKLGIIVVDEEHDASFKQIEGFRYSARDLAVFRGHQEQIPVILGSATPSLESLSNAVSGKYKLSKLTERPTKANVAHYQVIGTQHQKMDNSFSEPLFELIEQHLNAGNQVLVFLNRRGYSPVLICNGCGAIAACERCDARMTFHMNQNKLICHHCGAAKQANRLCQPCGSRDVVPLGAGTQRLEETLLGRFADSNIIRIDRDSTRRKGEMERLTKQVMAGEPAILVGTQLLAKGHHFPDVTLVAIVDVDSGFYSSDFRAIEKMGQLILQVGGRAGREKKQGTVAIQTQFPDQPILKSLIEDGYEAFANSLLDERRLYDLPPYSFQAVLRAEATKNGIAMAFLNSLASSQVVSSALGSQNRNAPSVSVLGPIPSTMEKRDGKYRAQLLISSSNRKALNSILAKIISLIENNKEQRMVRWSLDVDPIDLL